MDDDLRTLVGHLRTRFLSCTLNRFSFRPRHKSESSSFFQDTNITMQNCCSNSQPDIKNDKNCNQNLLAPCELCFEPTNPVIMSDFFHINRPRLCSEPVHVPNHLNENPPQRHSLGYESGFGNELSPTTTYWTLGVTDQSITSDDFSPEQDQSVFEDSTMTDITDEQLIDDNDNDDDDSFEVLSFDAPPESTLYIKEFEHTTPTSQRNACDCCNTAFTASLPGRRCHYYGKLYCPRCHMMEKAYIPAKILKSFDMRLYPVCRRARSILQLNFFQPVFDIQNDNEKLYVIAPILSEIRTIRTQFQHIYAYLSTCKRIENEFNEKFLKEFYARDYLYQSIHLYSLNDLLALKKILQTLQLASQRAKQHIYNCPICREKGFNCEICKNRKEILYPFDDIKSIGQCSQCSNIYHKQCWINIEQDCPKCYRLVQRRKEQTKP